MKKYNNSFYATTAFAIALFLSAPVFAQTVNNLTFAQPAPQPSEVPGVEVPQAPVAAPESSQPQPPAQTAVHHEQHKAKTTKHASATHHKKKKSNKSASANKHSKKASKKAETKPKHAGKKTAPQQQPHASNTHKHLRHQTAAAKANTGQHAKKRASDVSSATLPAVKHTASEHASNTANPASKSVTYNFCMGYDNCVPTRYETTSVGGRSGAKVLQKDKVGNWNEAKLDPAVMVDLGKMAQAENGSRVERDLTPDEKELIADHQGKAHATLVSAVNSGNKEEAKNTMRQLHIQNMNDLNAYDSRLGNHETAAQAVNEISVGR